MKNNNMVPTVSTLSINIDDPLNLYDLTADYTLLAILILAVIFIVLTISFNIFIILTVLFDKSMRNYTNIQFASMSFADILIGSMAMPFLLVLTLYGHWPLSNEYCILW